MKFFTPELVALCRSDDPQALDEAESRWEEAGEQYSQYLKKVRKSFPRGIRRLFHRYYFHDATIYRIGQRDRFFLIELKLDTPPKSYLTFRYRLLCPVDINQQALPPVCQSGGSTVGWLYSEIDRLTLEEVLLSPRTSDWVKADWLDQLQEPEAARKVPWPFWCHRILLSNGWELTLAFHDVEIDEYENLLTPSPVNGKMTTGELQNR